MTFIVEEELKGMKGKQSLSVSRPFTDIMPHSPLLLYAEDLYSARISAGLRDIITKFF
jgi:hypothetical protein